MRTIRPLVILSCLLLALAPGSVSADAPAGWKFELLDAGKGRKRVLRYKVRKGLSEGLELSVSATTSQAISGQASTTIVPTTRYVGEAVVRGTDASGAIAYELTFDKILVKDTRGTQRGTVGSLRRAYKTVTPMRATVVVSGRGIATKLSMSYPRKAPTSISEPLQGLYEALRRLHVPLPEEPVGSGARWRVSRTVLTGGISVLRRETYTLTRVGKRLITVEVAVTATAPKQPFAMAGLPKGMQVELVGVEGTEKGRLRVDLRRIAPIAVSSVATLKMRLSGRAGKRAFGLETEATTRTSVGRLE